MSSVRVRWNLVRSSIPSSISLAHGAVSQSRAFKHDTTQQWELCDPGKGQNPKPGSQRHVDSKRLPDESCSGLILHHNVHAFPVALVDRNFCMDWIDP
jgi:hypothetical protein